MTTLFILRTWTSGWESVSCKTPTSPYRPSLHNGHSLLFSSKVAILERLDSTVWTEFPLYPSTFWGLFTWREEDPSPRRRAEQRSVAFTSRSFGPWSAKAERELKKAGEKNKNAIWAVWLSLLTLITTFRQNYNNNQLVVTPNEMVGLYCRAYALIAWLPPSPVFFWFVPITRIFLERQFTWC